jgi:hypothetical protein
MDISHVGEGAIYTRSQNLKLKQILHVPQDTKNLVSVHRFVVDNNIFLEYHPYFFLIKDRATRKLLLKGKCHKGLYPLPSSFTRQVFGVSRQSFHRWHNRLGHPAAPIVQKVISLLIFLAILSPVKGRSMMLVSKPKAINYHIQNPLVF